MEPTEFDAALGGSEHLPHTANSLKFAAARSIEIATMTESILRPSKTKLIFQCLPVHMRRRVMSHNCKRLPRRLRLGHLEQLKKSGSPPKQKRPSRKFRRRPTNLLNEYNRRQKNKIWLETHIWHAKRFHMVERWGHRLPHRPCDKAFRACYRASSAHCLLQDISYYTPIQIKGQIDSIKDIFCNITSNNCGLGICAKAFLKGNRRGTIDLYMKDCYPFGFVGKVEFLWVCINDSNKELWLFVHPSQVKQVELLLNDITKAGESMITSGAETDTIATKKRKISTKYSEVQINVKYKLFNRFRLTGPRSHAVLVKSLKCVKDVEKVETNKWLEHSIQRNTNLFLKEKYEYWENVGLMNSPAHMPPGAIIGLVVKDPRLSRPSKRTKAEIKSTKQCNIELLLNNPPHTPRSPLWDETVCDIIKKNKVTNSEYIEHITQTQLIPGEVNEDDPFLQNLPIVLLQRPGSQDSFYKKIGYGSGWDIILPAEYGLPFWLTFIMFGARTGGLRETESVALEMGEIYMPPDSEAGLLEEMRLESELKEKYFRRPPSKRVNYIKLAVPSPFKCPWSVLLKDWSDNKQEKFYVLRDKVLLEELQVCIDRKKHIPHIANCDACLIPLYVKVEGKGNLTSHAMICFPLPQDVCSKNPVMEPHHMDENLKLRRQKRQEHKKLLKQKRRRQIKLKAKQKLLNQVTKQKVQHNKHEPSDYVKSMRELWLPSSSDTVRHVPSRQVMGYISQAAFSFSEARCCGIGYVALNALNQLLEQRINQVLIRNTTSRKYTLANINIIKTP
ncbi:hypothetical protein KGM_213530 [Danaus plexippus plexippus]|uniref:Uncharacterized protein n=1 Tax=Danaus plexippus plexippus TaxID=278856 RepID=A0A212ENX1_DANPL|nr:hypothetical protein KGM_213530 [Danaus plexippus plexippus]